MTDQTTEPGAPAEHAFTVTHYIRPTGDYAGFAQVTTGELSADDAKAWIDGRSEVAAQQGLAGLQSATEPPEAAPAGDGQPTLDEASEEPPADGQADVQASA
jgi:hypothetical protein